jgi:peptide/nickel transport system substrate-binding protein
VLDRERPYHEPLDPITRRSLIKAGAGGLGALSLSGLLAACGGGGGGGGGSAAHNIQQNGAKSTVEARRGGTIKVAFGDAISTDNPDPTTAFTYCSISYSGMCFDALTHLDNSWNVTPMLAEDWTVSPDLKIYTFKLRDGVEFHSGKTMDSKDVAFSFKRIFDKKVGSGGLSVFDPILAPSGIVTPDARTIRFELKQPDAYFLIKVGHWYGKVVPDGTADFSVAKGSFGTGPYSVKSFKGGEGFEVVRNPNYWQSGKPYLDGITAVVIAESATRAQSVLTGDADLTDPPTFPTLPQFESSSTAQLLEGNFGPAFDFGIDGSTAPFDNPDFRKASKLAVDRAKMVEIVARGFATVSPDTIVNPHEVYFPKGFEPLPHDPEQAASLVKKAGGSPELTIWTTDGLRALGDGATLLKEQWGEAGIKANIKSVSFDELLGKRFLQEKIVANYWLRQHFSTILPFMYTSGSPYDEARIKDPQLDTLVAQLQRTPLDKGGADVLRDVLVRYQNEAATLWPFHMKEVWAHKKRLQGLQIVPTEVIEWRDAFVS